MPDWLFSAIVALACAALGYWLGQRNGYTRFYDEMTRPEPTREGQQRQDLIVAVMHTARANAASIQRGRAQKQRQAS